MECRYIDKEATNHRKVEEMEEHRRKKDVLERKFRRGPEFDI